ncbi:MAG: response regulator [Candidatus Omnitrophica bacterium]|nr:response regulator [Candidatus Omnitrophota bacterium]
MTDNQIKVLVTDDEKDFRDLLAFWLKSKGYDVITASNGIEAVEKIKQESPDVVFLDLNMPDKYGTDTLKEIKSFNKDLPVIIISAHVDDRRAKEAMDLGVAGVFYKGSDFQQGLTLLEAALHTHKKLKK